MSRCRKESVRATEFADLPYLSVRRRHISKAVTALDHETFGNAVRSGRAAWCAPLVAAGAAGRRRLGAGACQRCARHRRGVVLGFTVPVLGRFGHPTAELFEHTMRPVSAGFAVPVFAFFAAGVTVGGWSGLGASLRHPVTDGVVAGLVIGKPLGVFVAAFLLAKFTHASLDDDLAWRDVFGVSLLAGIGFTVSLLIGELAFGHAPRRVTT
jgi:NhaA family Na+:H+ antiporter